MHDYIFKHDFSACSFVVRCVLVHTRTYCPNVNVFIANGSLTPAHRHRQRNKPSSNQCASVCVVLFRPLFLFDLIKWLKFLSSDWVWLFSSSSFDYCKLITFAYVSNYVFKPWKMNYKIPKLMLHTQNLFIFKYSLKEIYVYVCTCVCVFYSCCKY